MTQTFAPSWPAGAISAPRIDAFHHIDLTVTDVQESARWYQQVFGLTHLMQHTHPGGIAEVFVEPRSQVFIGLSQHRAGQGEPFAEHRTGLDHVSFLVSGRDELETWVTHLDRLDVGHAPIADLTDPFPYSVLVFRDPDNIQLELIAMGGPAGS